MPIGLTSFYFRLDVRLHASVYVCVWISGVHVLVCVVDMCFACFAYFVGVHFLDCKSMVLDLGA